MANAPCTTACSPLRMILPGADVANASNARFASTPDMAPANGERNSAKREGGRECESLCARIARCVASLLYWGTEIGGERDRERGG
jgi:hypothetical protein